jgi:hypothetical protein
MPQRPPPAPAHLLPRAVGVRGMAGDFRYFPSLCELRMAGIGGG